MPSPIDLRHATTVLLALALLAGCAGREPDSDERGTQPIEQPAPWMSRPSCASRHSVATWRASSSSAAATSSASPRRISSRPSTGGNRPPTRATPWQRSAWPTSIRAVMRPSSPTSATCCAISISRRQRATRWRSTFSATSTVAVKGCAARPGSGQTPVSERLQAELPALLQRT